MTPQEIVQTYFNRNYKVICWPHIGDSKGPKEKGWPERVYTLADYSEGYRVGLLTGTEVSHGHYLHDVDLDWAPGSIIAQKLLPDTDFIFGRSSKKISHCFYFTPEPLPSYRYEDVDKTCLIELRGTKISGEIGMQTMVPPSVWSKDTAKEPLSFIKSGDPGLVPSSTLKQRICLAAIGMILAKHLGHNGFGHEVRLAWAGFLLRAGIPVEDLVVMGREMSTYCNNLELGDVRGTIESTFNRMNDPKQRIKGGPVLARILGESGKAVIARINEWLGRDSDFIRDRDGLIIKDSQDNIKRALQLCEVDLSHQMFAERILINESGRPTRTLEDRHIKELWLRIDREYRFRPSFTFFEIVTQSVAYEHPFHPVMDYLSSLTWDGIPRIDQWLEVYGGAPDSTYHRAVASIALIAAVRRIRRPGCKYDEMLVLESGQGLHKSSALRALCPQDEWFSDDLPLNVDAKQIIERTLGKWIIEASDLAGKRKAEVEQLKAMLSRQVDGPARMAYAHSPVERARQFILIGTTNSAAYLMDSTGSRRFWPVKVQPFNVNGLLRDRDQLWAEAAAREAANASIRLPQELWRDAEGHQDSRREVDAWEEIIEGGLNDLIVESSTGRKQVATSNLWELIGIEASRRDRTGALRISEIMQRLGYERWKLRVEGKMVVGYISYQEKLKLEDK